jgi:hypothetical protein
VLKNHENEEKSGCFWGDLDRRARSLVQTAMTSRIVNRYGCHASRTFFNERMNDSISALGTHAQLAFELSGERGGFDIAG